MNPALLPSVRIEAVPPLLVIVYAVSGDELVKLSDSIFREELLESVNAEVVVVTSTSVVFEGKAPEE